MIKLIVSTASLSTLALSLWTASFVTPYNAKDLEIQWEWNGPDYKVTYECKGSFEKMGILDMQRKGSEVTVNYGALGRRRKGRSFKCNAPSSSASAGSR